MQHPDDRQLQLFIAAQLDAEKEKSLEEHLAQCPECRKRVSELERSPQDPLLQRMRAFEAEDGNYSETVDHVVDWSEKSSAGSNLFSGGDVLGGNLRLEKQLGRGGMGEAWKANDLMAGRDVVVKLVPQEIRHAEAAMGQVRETFQKVHALQHQHICPMMSLNDDPTYGLYVVMKFINGKTLDVYRKEYIAKNGRFPLAEILRILWDVARALDYSHERKVLHRDVKPQNIMISPEDGVQLIDFGLAAEIRSSMMQFSETPMDIAGTRPYMAPEQWRGRLQDAKTDQYALAVTAYELIAGRQPFVGTDVSVLRECVLNEEPEPIANMSEHINAALAKAMSKKREDRFPDCKAFVKALNTKPEKPVSPPPETPAPPTLKLLAPLFPPPPPPPSTPPSPNPSTIIIDPFSQLKIAEKTSSASSDQKKSRFGFRMAGVGLIGVFLAGIAAFFLLPLKPSTPKPQNVAAAKLQPVEGTVTENTPKTDIGAFEQQENAATRTTVDNSSTEEAWRPTEAELAGAPANFLEKLKKQTDSVRNTSKGFVAGQVFIDGKPALSPGDFDVQPNQIPTYHFENGWFVSEVVEWPQTEIPLAFYGKQSEKSTMKLKTEPNKDNVVFANVKLNTVSDDKLEDLVGRVVTEEGKPVAGVAVYASCKLTSKTINPGIHLVHVGPVKTDRDGKYVFPKLFPRAWTVSLQSAADKPNSNIATMDSSIAKTGLWETNSDLVVFRNKIITIETVYQPDGSTDFVKGNIVKGRYDLILFGNNDLAAGEQKTGGRLKFDSTDNSNRPDLCFEIGKGSWDFSQEDDYKSTIGHCDLGEVNFDSVRAADIAKIGHHSRFPCVLNHVHLIRTRKGCYAKFVVRSIKIINDPSGNAESPSAPDSTKAVASVEDLPIVETWQPTEAELAAAPAEFLEKLKSQIDHIKNGNKFEYHIFAGRVLIDGKPAQAPGDFYVRDTVHYENGWFLAYGIMSTATETKCTFMGIRSEEATMKIVGEPNKDNVVFTRIRMKTASDDKLEDLVGRVVTEEGKPVADVDVYAQSPKGTYSCQTGNVKTDHEGKYRFPKLFPRTWRVSISSSDKPSDWNEAQTGLQATNPDLIVLSNKRITIDTVFQPDGSTDFSKNNAVKGEYTLIPFGNGDTAKGNTKTGSRIEFHPTAKAKWGNPDLYFATGKGKFAFAQTRINNSPIACCDLGEVDFNSVRVADTAKLSQKESEVPCLLNHVYLVRTQEGSYAKFVVRSIDVVEPPAVAETKTPEAAKTVPAETKTPEAAPPTNAPQFNIRPAQNDWPSPADLAAAPADFNVRGKDIADQIKKKGGLAVAGQVVAPNGVPLKKGMYRVSIDNNSVYDCYDNGWFIAQHYNNRSSSCRCIAATFHYRTEFAQEIVQDKVNFLQIALEAIPDEQLATLQGTVQDEKNQPVANAQVKLTLGFTVSLETTTDAQGQYSFPKILPQAYDLIITSKQHFGSFAHCMIEPAKADGTKWVITSIDGLSRLEDQMIVTTIFAPRRVVIEAVLQSDGSTDLAARNTLKDRFALELFGDDGLIMGSKKTGRCIIFDPTAKNYEDMHLHVDKGVPAFFTNRRSGMINGIYSLGKVDFASVKEADPSLIQNTPLPCEVNHVYVVRTAQNGLFVKFIVRSIIVGDKDAPPASPASQPRRIDRDAAERQIKAALEKNVDIDFNENTRFDDLCEFITEKIPGVDVALDKHETGSIGLASQSPVLREPFKHKGIKLRVALWLVLRDQDLSCYIDHGKLWITTAFATEEKTSILDLPTSAEAARRINKALDMNVDIKFDNNSTFSDLFRTITEKNPGLLVRLEYRGAGALGITSASPVVKEPVTFKATKLRVVLQSVLSKQNLAYCVKNEVLFITSVDEAKRMTKSD